jgi:hypothetical protein
MIDHTLRYTPTVDPLVLNVSRDLDRFMCSMMDVTDRQQAREVREIPLPQIRRGRCVSFHNPRMSKDTRLYKTLMVGTRYRRDFELRENGRINEAFGRSKPKTDGRATEAVSRSERRPA